MNNYTMNLKVVFNRDIDSEKDYISPGGFEMVMNDNAVVFDFVNHYMYIDEANPKICTFELVKPDICAFSKFATIAQNDLCHISEIIDCFVYSGEAYEHGPDVVEILEISFILSDENGRVIFVPRKVINDYNDKLKIERSEKNE